MPEETIGTATTVDELIGLLEQVRDEHGGHTPLKELREVKDGHTVDRWHSEGSLTVRYEKGLTTRGVVVE